MNKEQSKKDFYTKLAKQENFPARSIYKLQEIDKKFGLFRAGDSVLDLGCSPGSWLVYIARKVGDSGKVCGIDIEEPKIELGPNMSFVEKDVLAPDILSLPILSQKYSAVVSDLAPHTTGLKFQDSQNSFLLCQRALEIAAAVLVKGGSFACKMFESEKTAVFVRQLRRYFKTVKIIKPQAVKKGSREVYLAAKNFIGN
ncbi:MAG: RlmE family RNA methyltransferase [Patescibacteria group bacterium]